MSVCVPGDPLELSLFPPENIDIEQGHRRETRRDPSGGVRHTLREDFRTHQIVLQVG